MAHCARRILSVRISAQNARVSSKRLPYPAPVAFFPVPRKIAALHPFFSR